MRLITTVLIVVAATGCSKPSADGAAVSATAATDSKPPAPAFDIDSFCDKTMAIASGRECEGDDELIEGNKIGFCVTVLRGARDGGRIRLDHDQSGKCIAAVQTAKRPLPDRRTLRDLALRFEPCRKTAVGLGQAGSECDTTMECSGGLVCLKSRCHKQAAAGEECTPIKEVSLASATSSCAPGLYCEGGKCKAAAKLAEGCATNASCGGELRCSKGKCAQAVELDEGERCENDGDCGHELYCARTKSPKCEKTKAAAEPCAVSAECRGRCSRSAGKCVAYCGSG